MEGEILDTMGVCDDDVADENWTETNIILNKQEENTTSRARPNYNLLSPSNGNRIGPSSTKYWQDSNENIKSSVNGEKTKPILQKNDILFKTVNDFIIQSENACNRLVEARADLKSKL